VKGFFIDHDLRVVDAFVVTILARHFDGSFIGFQPGRAKESIAKTRSFDQQTGQFLLQGDVIVVGAVDQLADLILQGRHQLRVVVPKRVDRDTAQTIEIGLAVDVPNAAPLSM